MGRALIALALLAGMLVAPSRAWSQVVSDTRSSHVSYVIEEYRTALAGWFTADECEAMNAIDASDTDDGDPQVLLRLAGDRALRAFAAMALDEAAHPRDAGELRAIPPVTDARTLDGALRDRVVTRARRHRDRDDVLAAERFARQLLAEAPEGPTATADARTLAAERAVLAASDALRRDDVYEVSTAAQEALLVRGDDGARADIVDAALVLLRDLVGAARGNPSAPTVPWVGVEPTFDALAEPVIAPHGLHGRAETHAADLWIGLPGSCIDTFACLPW